mgnify:CR=1 FL=1
MEKSMILSFVHVRANSRLRRVLRFFSGGRPQTFVEQEARRGCLSFLPEMKGKAVRLLDVDNAFEVLE